MTQQGKVSLRQVALKLGVAPSTVSRALRDSSRISESTKRLVRQTILEMTGGDEASLTIKPRGTSRNVAVLISRPLRSLTSDEFFSQVINGVVGCAEQAGYHVLLSPIDARGPWRHPRIFEEQRLDALIVGGVSISKEFREGLADLSVPVVYIGKHQDDPDHHAVVPDNVKGGRLAAEHLIACGYEHFAFLGGSLGTYVFRDRLEGFRRGLMDAGYTLRAGDIVCADIDRSGGYEGVKQLLRDGSNERLLSKRTGIFAATDWMAAGVVQALHDMEIGLPDPIGVVGYSDLELASHLSPPLTTIRVDAYALGHLALRLVEDVWADRVTLPAQIWTQPELVARATTVEFAGKENS